MNGLANVKIGKKLGLLIGAGVLQVVCIAGVAWWGLHTLDTQAVAARQEARRTALALQISSDANAVTTHIAGALLARKFDPRLEEIAALRKEYLADFAELATISASAEGKRRRESLEQIVTEWRQLNVTVVESLQAGRVGEAVAGYHQRVEPKGNELRANMIDYLKYRERQAAMIDEAQESAAWQTKLLLLVFAAFWMAASCVIGLILARSIAKPLEVAVAHLEEVARGDVSRDMPDEYLSRGRRNRRCSPKPCRPCPSACATSSGTSPTAFRWCPPRRRNCPPIRARCRTARGRRRKRPTRWPPPPSR